MAEITRVSLLDTTTDASSGLQTVRRTTTIYYENGTKKVLPVEVVSGPTQPAQLAASRARVRQRINDKRAQVVAAGCATPLGRVDTDETSRSNIQGLVAMAQIAGDDFSIQFRLADNDLIDVDAVEMTAIGLAVGQHVNATYQRSWQLKDELEAASSPEEVAALDINEGWPTYA